MWLLVKKIQFSTRVVTGLTKGIDGKHINSATQAIVTTDYGESNTLTANIFAVELLFLIADNAPFELSHNSISGKIYNITSFLFHLYFLSWSLKQICFSYQISDVAQ